MGRLTRAEKFALFIVPLGIVALCAGCGGTSLAPAPRLGTIEGFATPCVEMATLSAYNRLPVSVELHLAGRVVSRHSGKGTVTFRYLVPPGRYVVSSDQSSRKAMVNLLSGNTVKVDLISVCK